MGTVKYTGPVASFHCPTNAEIRSLKVHFSPKQLGSGDPSPENVREIVGWDGVTVQQTGKNLAVPVVPYLLPNIWVDNSKITTTGKGKIYSVYIPCKPNTTYTCSKSVESVVFVVCYTKEFPQIGVPIYGRIQHNNQDLTITTGSDAKYLFLWFYNNVYGDEVHAYEEVLNTIQIEESASVTHYESYRGRTTDYEFGVLGKNKLNAYGEQQPPSDTTSAPTTKRTFISDSYCVGMSWSNYYYPVQVTSYSVLNGTVTVSNVNVYGIGFPVKVFAGQAYCLSSTTTSNGRAHVAYFASDGTYISGVQTDIMNKSFVVPSNVSVAVIVLYSSEGEATFSDIQLELGSTATTYEPYDPKHTVYGGWIDLISGEVCEEWNVLTIDDTTSIDAPNPAGNEPWVHRWSIRKWDYNNSKWYYKNNTGQLLCDKLKHVQSAIQNGEIYGVTVEGRIYLYDDTLSTIEDFHTKYDGMQLCAPLSTVSTYSLSPTQLQTFLGYNNVWSNADYVEVEYDLHETQDILARKNFIIASQPHIETASGTVATFNTDMSAPLKECKIHFSPVQDLHGYDSPWPAGGGKNLLDMASENIVIRKYINNTGVVTSNNNNFYNSKYIPVKANTAYTLSVNKAISYCSFMEYDANKDFIQRTLFGASTPAITSETITTTANTAYVLIGSNVKYATIDINDVQAISWQFEEGSSATSYVPYENVCPIGGWTGCEVTRHGKNLFNPADLTSGQYFNRNGGMADNASYSYSYIRVSEGQTVIYSGLKGAAGNPCGIQLFDLNKNFVQMYNPDAQNNNVSVTIPAGISYIGVSVYSGANQTYNDVNTTQLEFGSTATAYEPYTGTTVPITFPSITNLLNFTTITTNKTLSTTGEEINENGMSLTNHIKVNEGDVYKLTFISKEGPRTRRIYGYDSNKDPVESLASASWVTVDTEGSIQATIPNGVAYIKVCYKTADTDIFLDGPASSIIYGGYIDLVNGEVVQEWYQDYVKNYTWNMWGSNTPLMYVNHTNTARLTNTTVYADSIQVTGAGDPQKQPVGVLGYYGTDARYPSYFFLRTALEPSDPPLTRQQNQTWIEETYPDTKVIFRLQTPIHHTLSPQTLRTLRGQNNVWSNANGQVKLSYWTH